MINKDLQKVITLIIIGGTSFWILDTAIDTFVFQEEENFWDGLLFDISLFEIYIRSIVWILFITIGAIFYKMLETTKKSEKEKINHTKNIMRGVSHDLRNSLSSINNAVYLLKDASGEKKEKMLDIIKRSVNSADTLLRNLTEFDKEITLNLEKTDINSLIKESLADLVIPDNIEENVAKNDVIQVNLDKEKIKRVFMNLFLNAIQAMPNGGKLTVTSTIKDNITEIVIQDTGVGISKNNLKKMFTPYFSTKNSGIGLGLTNTKRIIEAHKGTINIESKIGKGTTITINIPLK